VGVARLPLAGKFAGDSMLNPVGMQAVSVKIRIKASRGTGKRFISISFWGPFSHWGKRGGDHPSHSMIVASP
jgi:hypothetical protein